MSPSSSNSLVLTDEIKTLINNALENSSPLLLAAVGPDGKPVLSFRGSTQTYSDDQLGLWIRNGQGGTLSAIQANPNVVLVYRSATTPVLQFHGRAWVAESDQQRSRVFESAPERERGADPERKGVAIIIDLDRVEGVLKIGPNGRELVRLAR